MARTTAVLLWACAVHFAGIYLFTRGFLLTRLSLSEHTSCARNNCTLPPTHTRAVLLIVDALRFDFLTAHPPTPASPFHHNVLTVPAQLTAAKPSHSFLFNAYADPPTTTLQRIKGLTTGSLPTFVDLGNNFGGSSIAEDSILKQINLAGKRAAFMGDDTWMSVFPDAFQPNMTFPYDSFNVEDLHTVDEGVIDHLFPLLEDPSKPFDFLVGHFLGVDHVGHRVGPDHPSMKAKLTQMNDVLKRVVDLLDDDTILVVLGDHGMDRAGDHGGDGIFETSSALWVYSKGRPLMQTQVPPPSGLLRYTIYPGTSVPHRAIQQIDILPTLSLILGLPIPFNNLGTIIPELLWRERDGATLAQALEINAAQVKAYLDTYRASSHGGELDESWHRIQSAWESTAAVSATLEINLITSSNFIRVALDSCRAIWAQFNPLLMSLGLAVLAVGLIATWSLYSDFSAHTAQWDTWLSQRLSLCVRGVVAGGIIGLIASLASAKYLTAVNTLDCIIFTASLVSSLVIIVSSPLQLNFQSLRAAPILLILHSLSFFSNSFTFWEDRIVPFLLISSLVPYVLTGFSAPVRRLRYRILGFSLLFAICVRLMAISTVCREEQHPYCHVTFYASSSVPAPPLFVLISALPVAVFLPWMIARFLRITRANTGLARSFLPFVLRAGLTLAALFWVIEWLDSSGVLQHGHILRPARTWVARFTIGVVVSGALLWWSVPICLDIQFKELAAPGEKPQVIVIGYANAFGSPYLMFWTVGLTLVYLTTQLTGQIVLALATVALLSYLEVVDSVRDVRAIEATFASTNPSAILSAGQGNAIGAPITITQVRFADVVPVALLGMLTFFGTGHQAVISSIQWKSAFVLTPTVMYPYAPTTVVLNSVGPFFLMALAVPLLGLWNRAPLSQAGPNKDAKADKKGGNTVVAPDAQIERESLLAALGFMMYFLVLLLGTALSAAILRRHLMVWKVFAPRFMLGVLGVLVADIGVLVGISIGVGRVGGRIGKMFKTPTP